MKTKSLVMLGSFLVLAMLIVSVSVYAYNAYVTVSASSCKATASVNAWGLRNGSYVIAATVDEVTNRFGNSFANGNTVSDSRVVDESVCAKGSAYAGVEGYDNNGRHLWKSDSDSFVVDQ